MSRKPLIRTSKHYYHIVNRANNKEWFELPMEDVWKIAENALVHANERHPIELISFVLMSNHYHMILKTPGENLDLFMYEFNKYFSYKLRLATGRINRMFGGRYKWCLIRSDRYLANCYRYVYQNPIRAGLCAKCEDYPYSSLNSIVKGREFCVPITDHFGFKDDWGLFWLNESLDEDEIWAVRSGLSRSELTQLKSRSSRREIRPYLRLAKP